MCGIDGVCKMLRSERGKEKQSMISYLNILHSKLHTHKNMILSICEKQYTVNDFVFTHDSMATAEKCFTNAQVNPSFDNHVDWF